MIKVGDRLPEGSFRVKQDDGSVKQIMTSPRWPGAGTNWSSLVDRWRNRLR